MKNASTTFNEMHNDFLNRLQMELESMLSEGCTENQRLIFKKMYTSVSKIPLEKMDTAFWQVENTIRKNKANGVVT